MSPELKPVLALTLCGLALGPAIAQTKPAEGDYHIYAGNTHSHTAYTWSHGEQFKKPAQDNGKKKEPGIKVSATGVQDATKAQVLQPDWEKHQGPPAKHFALAKANSYDFYAVTDHSQEAAFAPTSPSNTAWTATQREAIEATDAKFVGVAGFEYSENNGPGGKGHINVYNTAQYLNALAPGVDLPYLYQWLKTVPANGAGPIVASFNHPAQGQYGNWAHRDPQVTEIITMLEVINSNKGVHYAPFISALDAGWKVSPICGNDNHGFYGITHHTSRTFVLATSRTKRAILEGMKNRRTYASLDGNIQCSYTVNGAIMGSTLDRPTSFAFEVIVSDPDSDKPKHKVTKLDIVADGGKVVATQTPVPAFTVRWTPTLQDTTNRYFFVRVWNAGGGDAPGASPERPVAWLAPVWTGK